MGLLSTVKTPAVQAAEQLQVPPPQGSPQSVALPGTAQPGRSPIYRHWRFQEKLLDTLDPNVSRNDTGR